MSRRARYVRIRFVRPAVAHQVVHQARVYALRPGHPPRDITGTVPDTFAGAFWRAHVGTRLRAYVFHKPRGFAHLRRSGRRRLVATRPVVFKFAEIVPRPEAP